jgi:NTE family protein
MRRKAPTPRALSSSCASIVTLAFFSAALPQSFLVESIARRLRAETENSIALVRFVPTGDEKADFVLGGKPVPTEHMRELEPGVHLLRPGVPTSPANAKDLGELLRNLRCRFDYVLLEAAAERLPAYVLHECVAPSRTACFFLRCVSEDLYHLDLLLHDLRPALNGTAAVEFKSVLCLAENEAVARFDTQIERVGIASQLFVRGCPMLPGDLVPAGSFSQDIRRVARDLGNCLVGLALSSGAAKGFAHIGVLQVLEENGIEPDVVAGSSMGAYVAAIWAFGSDGTQMEKLAREMEIKWALWSLIDPVFPPRQGFLRGYSIKHRLQRTIGAARFADLQRPLRVVAANLDTLERVVFSTGDVATAVHTSIAVPGICVPVRVDDTAYVDGGIVDPLPTDVLQEMGIRKIIAVNAIPTAERVRLVLQKRAQQELEQNAEHRTRKLFHELLPFNEHMNYCARGNILEILMHSIHGAQIRMAEASCRRASVVLRPDICNDRWMDFRNPGQYIAAGREAAEQQLDEIKALVRQKGASDEIKPAPIPMAATA